MLRRHLLAFTGAGSGAPSVLRAQGAWLERPVRLVVSWPPGGSADLIARILQPKLSEALDKPLVIDNRGGASGSIGATEVARTAPDGHTRLFALDTEATNQTTIRLP
jgi:tripartite-type tricarboxylate transporter receptor subunit TctC